MSETETRSIAVLKEASICLEQNPELVEGHELSRMEQTIDLPRILCLHGGGTSAMIFKIQLRRLVLALQDHFTFIFVSAPTECGPGPGVLPVFADLGPYYRWTAPEGQDPKSVHTKNRVVLRDAMTKDGGAFVGVLGFSQGARMAAGLLTDQERGKNTGMPDFKFGVMLCGSYPPYSNASAGRAALNPANDEVKADEHGEIREPDAEEIIQVPTVHMKGLQDVHLEKGRRLAQFFSNKVEFEFDHGHHLPGAAGDTTSPKTATAELARAILQQYETGSNPSGIVERGAISVEDPSFTTVDNRC